MLGLVSSITVTFCVPLVVLPLPSTTVQVTVVVPKLKLEGALLVTEAIEQLSVVTALPNLTPVAAQLLLAETVKSLGTTKVGDVVSFTVMV